MDNQRTDGYGPKVLLVGYSGANYMNFSIRLGYHFSMVEAFAGDMLNDNYVRFFFEGGGAATDRRLRRVRLISELLEMMDLRVKVTEDVINAVLLKFKRPEIERRLEAMGRMTVFPNSLTWRCITTRSLTGTGTNSSGITCRRSVWEGQAPDP